MKSKVFLLSAMGDMEDDVLMEAYEYSPKTKRMSRPLRIALVAAAVVVLLACSVFAVYRIHEWNAQMEAQYNPNEIQKELVDPSIHDVGVSVTQDDCTYTIRQIIGDNYFMAVALDVTLPEGLVSRFTTEELRAIAEENGYPWTVPENVYGTWSVTQRLSDLYDYDTSETAFAGGFRIDMIEIAATTATKDEIEGAVQEMEQEYADADEKPLFWENEAICRYLNNKVIAEQYGDAWDGSYDGSGSGIMKQSFDPETNTLSVLIYTYTGSDTQISGCEYTIVLNHLMAENILDTYSKPYTGEFYPEAEETELTTSPVVLNFKADYTPISQEYDVLENGETVGMISLSPLSLYAEISLEDEPTSFSSLENAAEGSKKRQELMNSALSENGQPKVYLKDGTTVAFTNVGAGATDHFSMQSRAGTILDLEQVESITWYDYTIVPR